MFRTVVAGAIVAATMASFARADEVVARSYVVPGGQRIELQLPAGWRDDVRTAEDSRLPTVSIRPDTGAAFSANVTVRMVMPPGGVFGDSRMRLLMEQQAGRMAGAIGAEAVQVSSIDGSHSAGYFFSISEPRFKPGEFQHLTSGLVTVENITMSFDVLTNDGGEGVVKDMLAAVSGARMVDPRGVLPEKERRATSAEVTVRPANAAETRMLQDDVGLASDVSLGISTDLDVVVGKTYPRMSAIVGGAEMVRRAYVEAGEQSRRMGMSIEARDFPDTPTIITTAKQSYAIVPTRMVVVVGGQRAESYNFQFGILEPGAAGWTYIEGSRVNNAILEDWFPDFPLDYQFPRVSRQKL